MSDIKEAAPPADTPTKADSKSKPPADAGAVFSRVEKYLQGALDDLGAEGSGELASMRGAISTALAILRSAKPGGNG